MKNIIYVKNPSEVYEALEYLNKKKILGFDTETNGLDPFTSDVLLLQLGDTYKQFVFDVFKIEESIHGLLKILANPGVIKVAHNAKFDYSMIKANTGVMCENLACTYVGAALLTGGMLTANNSLDSCLDKYLGVKVSKNQQKSFAKMQFGEDFTEQQIEYAGTDVEYMIPLYKKLLSILEQRGKSTLYEMEREAVRVCGDMELNGIFLDTNRWKQITHLAVKDRDDAKEEVNKFFRKVCAVDMFNEPVVNYSSPVQVKPLLEKITGEKIESTDSKVLSKIKHPVINPFLKFKKATKIVTTYGENFARDNIHKKTKRIHSNFKQLGAGTGRMASRNPNMQNIPNGKEVRACFRAQHKGWKLICCDFASQELRLIAHITQEPEFLYALENDMDLHAYSASIIFNLDYESFFQKDINGNILYEKGEPVFVPEMKTRYRAPCKAITFGLAYGMGAGKLAADMNISLQEAKDLIQLYFEKFPRVKSVLENFVTQALKNNYAYSPLDGRRRLFVGVDWDHSGQVAHMKNIAKNLPFQGAGASVTKLALCKMKKSIDRHRWEAMIILVVHDEILIEAKEEIAQEVAAELERCMISAFNFYAPSVKMTAKAEIADHWVH